MINRRRTVLWNSAGVSRTALAACALVLAASALGQEAPPSQSPGQATSQIPSHTPGQGPSRAPGQGPGQVPGDPNGNAPLPNSTFRPGFIDEFNRWLEDGASKFKSGVQRAQDKVDSVVGLPSTRATSGRERCARAQNGAPDCQAAAVALCRGKGLQTGKSLDTQSEQKCPAKVLLEGRAPNNTECPTELFVTRAMCQ